MRKRCLDIVYRLAKSNKDVVFIGSDLGVGVMDNFKKELPEQFFMEGISEQHIIGMAAGLSMSGKVVYFNTIATFITRRCFEQSIIDLGLSKAKVRLIGSGGGLVYAPLGPTHLAFEDIAIMRAIPNMSSRLRMPKWAGVLASETAHLGSPRAATQSYRTCAGV